jgi:peptide/nickel transport system substrate-binding protein
LLFSATVVVGAATVGVAAGATRAGARSTTPHRGGTLTVLESSTFAGDWPQGLDPATDGDALANSTMMNAIYGGLFEVGPGGQVVDDLASGYQLSDGSRVLTIDLRPGVRFSDGSRLDAAVVLWNWRRDLAAKSPSNPAWPAITSMTAVGPSTVRVRFQSSDGAAIDQLQDTNFDWIISQAAYGKLGEQRFRFSPVGAGPFVVTSDIYSSKLVLRRNPHYWEAGRPYLNGLVFQSVASDEAALEDLQSGTGQAYEFMGTPQLVPAFKKAGFTVTEEPGTAATDVKLNTATAPFDNKLAREALYYATDAQAINKDIYGGSCPITESFTGPGGLFYEPKVPNYRTYDLAKAKAIVKQLGGVSFTLFYTADTSIQQDTATALQSMYQSAGMNVRLLQTTGLPAYIQEYLSGKWQADPAGIGSWDPAGGIGVAFDLQSHAPFSGVHDPHVDELIAKAAAYQQPANRARYYAQLAEYLNQQAYTPFICAPSSWDVSAKGVEGEGLTAPTPSFVSGSIVLWQDVSMGNG